MMHWLIESGSAFPAIDFLILSRLRLEQRRSRNYKTKRSGKPKAYRHVLRHSRMTLVAIRASSNHQPKNKQSHG